jgi:putative salt-induced outer membrane protein
MPTLLLALSPLLLANQEEPKPDPPKLPDAVETMLLAAFDSGNEGEVNTIAKYAKAAAPDMTEMINRRVGDWKRARSDANQKRLSQAGFFELVKGRAEVGAWLTTGNTDNIGLNGVLDLRREGWLWRHKLRLQADYQESLGVTNRERYLAAYEPNYKLDDRAYIYGAAQFESDRFRGYTERYSASLGAGYSAIKRPDLTLDIELGPAFRHTEFINAPTESNLATRGSVDFSWKLTRAITFDQDASAYLQSANSTVSSKSALRAKLFGPLSGQMSYTVQYESKPPVGRVSTDTISRASIVYDF